MAKYRAAEGREDRHGEMTGAISINMAICALPVTVWCVWIGPWLFDNRLGPTLASGAALAVILPIACLKPSQWIWAHISEWMDRF